MLRHTTTSSKAAAAGAAGAGHKTPSKWHDFMSSVLADSVVLTTV